MVEIRLFHVHNKRTKRPKRHTQKNNDVSYKQIDKRLDSAAKIILFAVTKHTDTLRQPAEQHM